MHLEWHACVLAGILRVAYTRIKGQAGGSDTYRRHESTRGGSALYKQHYARSRANINYCGFNIGRRRWPWPTTS